MKASQWAWMTFSIFPLSFKMMSLFERSSCTHRDLWSDSHLAMGQNLLGTFLGRLPLLKGFLGSPGVRGFDPLPFGPLASPLKPGDSRTLSAPQNEPLLVLLLCPIEHHHGLSVSFFRFTKAFRVPNKPKKSKKSNSTWEATSSAFLLIFLLSFFCSVLNFSNRCLFSW